MEAPGKGMLKVVSILFIVFGAIAIILSIVALAGSAWLNSAGNAADSAVMASIGGLLVAGSIILLISSALELIIGIIGIRKSDDPSQAKYFIVTGIILSVLTLIGMIISFSVTSLIGFVLPVLYIIGGYMNKKAAA